MPIRMPAEWETHQWTWIGFPWNSDEWHGALEGAQRQIADFATAVYAGGRGEAVRLIANDAQSAAHARALVGEGVDVVTAPIGDVWLRDTGPIGVATDNGRIALADFGFNGWGGKYLMLGDEDIGLRLAKQTGLPVAQHDWVLEGGAIDTDGTGLFVTTEQCLLNPNRNPSLDRRRLETLLGGALGLNDMLWLGDGLINDHTDGHVDNLARFVGPGLLALPTPQGDDDPNAAIYADAAARAKAFGVSIAPLPSPGRIVRDRAVVPASYMNFYIGNAAVVVPLYGVPNDDAAIQALGELFPDRAIVGLPSDAILSGGGSFHCTSQQMPKPTTDELP